MGGFQSTRQACSSCYIMIGGPYAKRSGKRTFRVNGHLQRSREDSVEPGPLQEAMVLSSCHTVRQQIPIPHYNRRPAKHVTKGELSCIRILFDSHHKLTEFCRSGNRPLSASQKRGCAHFDSRGLRTVAQWPRTCTILQLRSELEARSQPLPFQVWFSATCY